MKNLYFKFGVFCLLVSLVISQNSTLYAQCVAPTPTTNNVSVTCGQAAMLSASGGTNYTWYSNAAGTNQVATGATFTTPALSNTTTYYLQNMTGSAANVFNITSLSTAGATFYEHNTYTGDDRGGIAVTQQYCYVTGDQNTARYDMPNLTNPVSYTRRDGIVSDMAGAGTLYTLWNNITNTDPVGTCTAFTLNAIRTLNSDCSLGNTIIPTSQSISMGSCNDMAIFNGVGFIVVYTGSGGSPANTFYRIDLPSGTVTQMGTYTLTATFTENWSRWGVAEYDGVNYSVVYVQNSTTISRMNMATGTISLVQSFANLSDMANITYSPWNNRWYYHHEGGSQWGGSDESIGYLSGTHNSIAANACYSPLVPVTVTVNSNITPPTAAPATINCGQTASLTAAGGSGGSYTWYSDPAGTQVIGSGATFTTPSLGVTTTYYVASTSGQGAGSTFTFSNASATGPNGPTQAQITAAYANSNLANNVTINTQGIQEWIVPMSGTYQIQANGAQGGGNGGLGARMQGEFSLTQGQKLFIVVGQQGNGPVDANACGGGGGSFVTTGAGSYTTSTALLVAGGGGGQSPQVGNPGLITNNGGQGENCQPGGTGGNGGADASACGSGAGGAGGFLSDGASGGSWGSQRGFGFISGAAVGGSSSSGSREGGFGGGAGTHQNNTGGGAGGGYSGGSAAYHGSNYEGGGGGSFNSGTNQVNTQGINAGHGSVIITSMTPMCASATVPVTVTVNSVGLPTTSNVTVTCGQTATLTASGNGTVYWYSNAQGTTQVGTGNSFTTPQLSTNTTYYASLATGVCAGQNVPVVVTVNLPASPTASGATITCGQTAALTASGGGLNSYVWYSNAIGTNQVGTGATYTTPSLSMSTTYYVASGIVSNSQPVSFAYTGNTQTYTVPAGVTSITVDANGAGGGVYPGGVGTAGAGGKMIATIPVTPGQILTVVVGGAGGNSQYNRSGSGGGGFSGVLDAANNHLVSAGGGGGAAGNEGCPQVGNGGNGGAAAGTQGSCGLGGAAGINGATPAGGAGGTGSIPGLAGNATGGGNGGATPNDFGTGGGGGGYGVTAAASQYGSCGGNSGAGGFGGGGSGGTGGCGGTQERLSGGGGGGGGYTGGGGGTSTPGCASCGGGGGGGGSNFAIATASNITSTVGGGAASQANGTVVITPINASCQSALVPVLVTVNSNITQPTAPGASIACGQTATLTATGGSGTGYTWYSDSTGATALATGANYTTPSLGITTTYYVASTTGAAPGSVYTFTNAGSTGPNGPTQAQVNSAYAATNLANNVTINTQGIQEWVVPQAGTYQIQVNGAQGGGDGGLGARMQGEFNLTAGQKLFIAIGQQGNGPVGSGACGGGGGSFVTTGNATYTTSTPLIIAGGGGGQSPQVGNPGLITTNGGQGEGCQPGGTGGNGGADASGCGSGAGGAGGFLTDGASAGSWGYQRGFGFLSGAAVGGQSGSGAREGGFGGGAGTHENNTGGGAGGGYSGGSAANHGANFEGGGGGSYNNGTNQVNTQGINVGHGSVVITPMTPSCASNLVPVTVTVNPISLPTATGATVGCGQTATLTATGNGTLYWYSNAAGTTQIATGGSFTTPALSATTTYYVSTATGVCAAQNTPVTVTVNGLAAPTVSGNVNFCGNNNATTTLTASGSPSGYSWWSNANGTGFLGNSASFTTPVLNTTTTYYVQSSTPQGGSQTFNYTGAVQSFTAPVSGTYTLEVWGAKGGGGANCYGVGGKGGYSKGNVVLNAGQTIYVAVGQQGFQSANLTSFNGGGSGNPQGGDNGYTGGGATHIATANGTLSSLSGNQNSVLLVAGGGGAAAGGTCVCQYQGDGGAGGGTTGVSGVCSANDCGYRPAGTGGSQIAGGTGQTEAIAASFGQGASASLLTNDCIQGGGGGGGWYGGGAGGQAGGGGGGGSGYLNPTLTATQILDGNSVMPDTLGNNMTGNNGNGVAKITWQGTGCTSAVVPVVVSVGQAPTVSGGNNQTVCAGNTVTLSGSGAATYTWNNNVQDGVAFTPITTQTYAVIGTAANGCSDTATVTVTVSAAPDVNAGQDQSVCSGTSVTLNGAGATNYTWNNNVQNGVPFTPTVTQTYTLTGTNAAGCSATDQVTVTVNQAPTVSLGQDTVVCENNFPYQITATGTPGSTYSWDNGATGNPVSVAGPGTFTVTVTDANGCIATDEIIIESDPCAGIIEQGMSIILYPNPFNENVQITSTESIDAQLEVYGSDGRIVYTTRMNGQHATLSLSNLARGNYMVKIVHNGTTHVTKLVKQ